MFARQQAGETLAPDHEQQQALAGLVPPTPPAPPPEDLDPREARRLTLERAFVPYRVPVNAPEFDGTAERGGLDLESWLFKVKTAKNQLMAGNLRSRILSKSDWEFSAWREALCIGGSTLRLV